MSKNNGVITELDIQKALKKYGKGYKIIIQHAERIVINEALKATDFNQSEASRLLGVNRGTLLKKIKQYKLI